MEFLSEDVSYLAGGLAIVGGIFVILLRSTQQGKYLIWAMSAFGLAALAILIETFWVTDTERIEDVVYKLRDAVAASDPPKVFAELTPDAEYGQQQHTIWGEAARNFISLHLRGAHFDFLRITHLEANAGRQSGRGSAVFRVVAGGSYQPPLSNVTYNFGTTNLDFSLGFQEVEPKVWKVDRITVTRFPTDLPTPGGGPPRPQPKPQGRYERRFMRFPHRSGITPLTAPPSHPPASGVAPYDRGIPGR